MEIIDRGTDSSNPEKVMAALDEFANKYEIAYNDELWMLVDRDYQSWSEKELSYVAQHCHMKKGYHLGLSNPAFEIWLLLHLKDINVYSEAEKKKIFKNSKVSQRKTYLKKMLSDLMPGGYTESSFDVQYLLEGLNDAIDRGKKLDVNPHERWPNRLGTRVYRLVERIRD